MFIPGCPNLCQCSNLDVGTKVDCRNAFLRTVPPDLPSDTVELYLTNNSIFSLNESDLENCTQLEILDFSENRLNYMESSVYRDTIRLKQLLLNGNNLSWNEESVPLCVFCNLFNLRTLYIHGNNIARNVPYVIWNGSRSYRKDIFQSLNSLEHLKLDSFVEAKFTAEVFSNLRSLRYLEIYGEMRNIASDTFEGFANIAISRLKIQSASLEDVDSLAFSRFNWLEKLDLSFCERLGLENVSKAWHGLRNTSTDTLILTRIVKVNKFSELKESFFRHLNATNVTSLYLDKNNIEFKNNIYFRYLPKLRYLNLAYNRMTTMEDLMLNVYPRRRLRYLDISNQQKRFMNNDAVKRRSVASEVNTAGSSCSVGPTKPCQFPRLKWLFGSQDSTKVDQGYGMDWPRPGASMCILSSPHLEVVNMSEALDVDAESISQITIVGKSRVSYLSFKGNGIRTFSGQIIFTYPNPWVPFTFDLSLNRIECLPFDFLEFSVSRGLHVHRLLLSHNNLGNQLESEVDGDVFKNYPRLHELDLSGNEMKNLPFAIFQHQSNLGILNLSRNSLRSIDFKISHLVNLTILDLSNNLIEHFTGETRHIIEDLRTRNAKLTLDLEGNPFHCSCDTLESMNWMQDMNDGGLFHRYPRYTCLYNGTVVNFGDLQETVIDKLNLLCSSKTYLIVSSLLLGTTLLLVALSVVFYRHRWEIKFFCVDFVLRKNAYRLLTDDPNDYVYDAFVAYSQDDFGWVTSHLLTNLESPNSIHEHSFGLIPDSNMNLVAPVDQQDGRKAYQGRRKFRFCVGQRDFVPGAIIEEEIIRAIETSRKTILVLSDSFLESNWCIFEFNMARVHAINHRKNIIIAVMLKGLTSEMIPTGMRALFQSSTYISNGRGSRTNRQNSGTRWRFALAIDAVDSERHTT